MKAAATHFLLALALIGLLFFLLYQIAHAPVLENFEPVACTLEAKLCPDGSAVGRVGPSCEFAPCPTVASATPASREDLLEVTSPLPGIAVSSPVTVNGQARGYWFFEATAPVVVVNGDGLILGEGYIEAQGEWMTEEFVPFTGVISYTLPPNSSSTRGSIIFQKSNPSGLPEYDEALEIPIELE